MKCNYRTFMAATVMLASREVFAYNRPVELLLVTSNRITVENLYQDLQP